jgi:hypothetical protein
MGKLAIKIYLADEIEVKKLQSYNYDIDKQTHYNSMVESLSSTPENIVKHIIIEKRLNLV